MTEPIVYNNQTAFTAMRKHVLSMTEPCYSHNDDSCVYNGKTNTGDDNHCAVGILLVGIELSEHENIGGIALIIDLNPKVKKRIGKCTEKLLRVCQSVHDQHESWGEENSVEKRKASFDNIALDFNLKVETGNHR